MNIGQRVYWLRSTADTSEGSLPAVLDTVAILGKGDGLALKVAEGLTFMHDAEGGLPAIAAAQALCAARFLDFLPVVLPRGLAGEGELHGAIAAQCGVLCIDAEPFSGYWDQAPHSEIPLYLRAVRQAAPNATLILQPDPRPYAVQELPIDTMAQWVDGFAPQHYVGWLTDPDGTVVGWNDVALELERFAAYAATGLPVYPALWGTGDLDLTEQFWNGVKDRASGMQWFAIGPMNTAQLERAATFALPLAPVPTPTPAAFDDPARLKLIGYIAGGSGPADITAWLKGYA